MKQALPTETDWQRLFQQWLVKADAAQLLLPLLNLCEYAGLYVVDNEQTILHWSPVAERLTGLHPAHLIGNPAPSAFKIVAENRPTELQIANKDVAHPPLIALPPQHSPSFKGQGNVPLVTITQALLSSAAPTEQHAHTFIGGLGLIIPDSSACVSEMAQRASSAATKMVPNDSQNFHGIISRSPVMQDVFHIIKNAAETAATVLVRGESGVGKELVAKAIHDLSIRRDSPFLAINCAALSSNLLESELFGHVRGAFTGAIKDHSGLFQRAHGGTLFLDEVAELPLELQAKLLRVIQERNVIPVGGDHLISTDVRLVAATHRSLREEVKAGRFREDLMYRLRVVPIFIPPLRERREDVSVLIWHFIEQHNAENFRKIEKIEPQAMRALLDYQWRGNVRELHNVVEYAFAVGRGVTLRYSELPPEFREPHHTEPSFALVKKSPLRTEEQEMLLIREALTQHHGQINPAANALGMSRATFWRKRKHYGL